RSPAKQSRHPRVGRSTPSTAGLAGPKTGSRVAEVGKTIDFRLSGRRPSLSQADHPMGVWQRFTTWVRSNVNDLIGRAEDPEKMLNQLVADMRAQLARVKQEVAGAIAEEKKLQGQDEKEKQQAEE